VNREESLVSSNPNTMSYRRVIALLIVVFDRGCNGLKCEHDGQLLPNSRDCHKYYKCSQGKPSDQSCPGTLIFDPILKICNWPDSTTCIADLLPKKKKQIPTRLRPVKGDDESEESSTKPKLTEEEEKRRKEAIASLFHVRDRKTSLLSRRRPRPRNSLTTTTERSTSRNTFANRGSQNSRQRIPTRQREPEPKREPERERESFLSKASQERRHDEETNDESVADDSEVDDVDSEEYRKQKIKEKILRDLLGDSQEFATRKEPKKSSKPTAKPIKCHTGASNELYPNPRNCRKYYKCEAGGPSLQSCPANLIFDSGLKICNWPDATSCEEDPDAPLPVISSSDRHPAINRSPAINTIDTESLSSSDQFTQPAVSSVPSPSHGNVPSHREATEREKLLTQQYPLFEKVANTVRTLDTSEVEKIEPGSPSNPDNVQRVEFILSEDNFEDLFPRRHSTYTYRRLLQAIGKFPAICNYNESEDKSDKVCRKTLATMFAHFTQETGNHNPSDADYDEWRQGLSVVRESGCTDNSQGCGYNSNCEDTDLITRKWACGGTKGKYKKYYGRGAKQLSYNFNYGQFSQAMFGDGRLLLDYPDFVATTWLNLASATWFYTTPQPPKPSMLHVIDGTWVPNSEDKRNGIEPGFGATINIINGGLECNKKNGRESNQAKNRIAYYKQFAWYLYVDYKNESLGCANQQQFSAGGAGALPIYWDKDWSAPYSCKLVPYQTAFSALVPGEYVECVQQNFNVVIKQ